MTGRWFYYWILTLAVGVAVATVHQKARGEVTASLDQAVTCKVITYVTWTDETGFEHMTTKLDKVKGYASEVVDEEYFIVDFTNDMFIKKLSERHNNYVQTMHVSDCGLTELSVPGNTRGEGLTKRFKGDSEDY